MAIRVVSSPVAAPILAPPNRLKRRQRAPTRRLPGPPRPRPPIRQRPKPRLGRLPASRFRRLPVAPHRPLVSRFHRPPDRLAQRAPVRPAARVDDPVVTPDAPQVARVVMPVARVAPQVVAVRVVVQVVLVAVAPAGNAGHLVEASGVVVAIATSCSPRSSRTRRMTHLCQTARSSSSAAFRHRSSAQS